MKLKPQSFLNAKIRYFLSRNLPIWHSFWYTYDRPQNPLKLKPQLMGLLKRRFLFILRYKGALIYHLNSSEFHSLFSPRFKDELIRIVKVKNNSRQQRR